MNLFYDRAGNPITAEQFEGLLFTDYRVVEQETVGVYWVSTVWLGVNHDWSGGGPPIIFETMVFSDEDLSESFDQIRYATEDEARAGHAATVALVRASLLDVPNDLSAELGDGKKSP